MRAAIFFGGRLISAKDFWAEYFSFHEDADLFAEQIKSTATGSKFIRPSWPLQLTPYAIDENSLQTQASKLDRLAVIIQQLPDLLFEGDICRFAGAVGYDQPAVLELLRQNPASIGLLPCRWDIISKNGQWKAIEANFGGALGGMPFDDVQKLYDDVQKQASQQTDSWRSVGKQLALSLQTIHPDVSNAQIIVVDDADQLKKSPLTANSVAALLTEHMQTEIDVFSHSELPDFVSKTERPIVTFELFTLRDMASNPDDAYDRYLNLCDSGRIRRSVSLHCDLFMSKAVLALLRCVAQKKSC